MKNLQHHFFKEQLFYIAILTASNIYLHSGDKKKKQRRRKRCFHESKTTRQKFEAWFLHVSASGTVPMQPQGSVMEHSQFKHLLQPSRNGPFLSGHLPNQLKNSPITPRCWRRSMTIQQNIEKLAWSTVHASRAQAASDKQLWRRRGHMCPHLFEFILKRQ